MKQLANAMRMQAQMNRGTESQTKMGTVTSYNPADYTVKVALQPDGNETGWLPLAALGVGQGWGMIFAPGIGDMVEVQFQEGNIETGMACARFFNDEDRPMPVPSGEFWLVHQSGSLLKFKNDGSVLVSSASKMAITSGADMSVTSSTKISIVAPLVSINGA